MLIFRFGAIGGPVEKFSFGELIAGGGGCGRGEVESAEKAVGGGGKSAVKGRCGVHWVWLVSGMRKDVESEEEFVCCILVRRRMKIENEGMGVMWQIVAEYGEIKYMNG